MIEGRILKLADYLFSIKVRLPRLHCPSLICLHDIDTITATEVTKGGRFSPSDFGPIVSFFLNRSSSVLQSFTDKLLKCPGGCVKLVGRLSITVK